MSTVENNNGRRPSLENSSAKKYIFNDLEEDEWFKEPDGSKYKGEQIEKGGFMRMKHGVGTQVWPDGSTYTGEWQHNTQNGKGIFTRPNGDYYKGEVKNGKPHGSGELIQIITFDEEGKNWACRSKYIGEFFEGEKHGDGTFIW